jgi:predicted MFS family arabinose efflux permease
MVAGALIYPFLTRRLRFGVLNAIGPVSGLIAGALLAAMVVLPTAYLATAAFFLFGAGPRPCTISSTTLRQTIVPRDMLGRVSALFTMATYGSRPLGSALGGVLGGLYGPEACILVAFFGFVLQAMFTLLSPVAGLSKLPDEPISVFQVK